MYTGRGACYGASVTEAEVRRTRGRAIGACGFDLTMDWQCRAVASEQRNGVQWRLHVDHLPAGV